MTSQVGEIYLKMCGAVLRIQGYFSDSLAQSRQNLWSLKGLPTTTVAGAGVKGL